MEPKREIIPGQRGGYRPGGGRKPGQVNTVSAQARQQASLTGKLPHEILLDMARGEPVAIKEMDTDTMTVRIVRWESLDAKLQKEAATAASGYYAPKLSTVELITGMSDDDLDSIIASAAAEAAGGHRDDGEGQAGPAAPAGRERKRLPGPA